MKPTMRTMLTPTGRIVKIAMYTISTPTGRRVLHYFEGTRYAVLRNAFAPENSKIAHERLRFRRDTLVLTAEPDGLFIGPAHLLAIGVGMAKKARSPLALADIVAALFYGPLVPKGAAEAIASLPDDSFLRLLRQRSGSYDSGRGVIVPIL